MKRTSIALAILASLVVLPAQGENTLQLSWEDLAPQIEFEDPFEALAPEQASEFGFVYWMIQRQKQDPPLDPQELTVLAEQFNESVTTLTAAGVDIDRLVAQQEEIEAKQLIADNTMVEELNAASVKIPGYALPLEYGDNNLVTEFLLVPYVGACIHTPPPPPNQIVHVRSERGIEMNSLFEPLLVSGQLAVKQSEQDLTFIDGSASVDVGYFLLASAIEAYDY